MTGFEFDEVNAPTLSAAAEALQGGTVAADHSTNAPAVRALVLVAPAEAGAEEPLHNASAAHTAAAQTAARAELLEQLRHLRRCCPCLFLVLWHPAAVEDAALRWQATQAGANMITHSSEHLDVALGHVSAQLDGPAAGQPALRCEFCGMGGLSLRSLWRHHQLYHSQEGTCTCACQVCLRPVDCVWVHLHNEHNPTGERAAARTGLFALVVVRRPSDGKFLVVQERRGVGYWLPGGGVDAGESLQEGAVRECIEEAGIVPVLEGVLDVQMGQGGKWRRVIFLARPADALQVAKTCPDYESSGACWVHADELAGLTLRSAGEMAWLPHLAAGAATVLPLAMPEKKRKHFQGVRF